MAVQLLHDLEALDVYPSLGIFEPCRADDS